MTIIRGIILCEGETDQALLGSYLEHTKGWNFFKNDTPPFQSDNINWFKNNDNNLLGIWQVGGCDFSEAIRDIAKREKLEATINRVAIVTDYDEPEAKTIRLKTLLTILKESLSTSKFNCKDVLNKWGSIGFLDKYGQNQEIIICYLLVPNNKQGALETFMLNSLLEQDEEKENVIRQCRAFVNSFSSEKYLIHRREKIKAELGVSLSIFSPDRIFTTLKELIDSVNWGRFDTVNEQFGLLKEI